MSECADPAAADTEAERLLKAAASALQSIALEVEEMGLGLAADPDILARHMTSLQSIDEWSQHLSQLASVIAADDRLAAVDRVNLDHLKRKLRDAA